MLGFTLSKFSLLILVVAMFSIASFFTFHLTESLKIKALNDLLANNSAIASEMMSSPSYCDELLVKIPDTVRLSASETYYVMRISFQTSEQKNYLLFSAAERSKPSQTIAASSSPTTATVKFYNPQEGIEITETGTGFLLDPNAKTSDPNFADAFYLVKEMNDAGEVILYVFPCSISGGISSNCQAAKDSVGRAVHHGEAVEQFKCG